MVTQYIGIEIGNWHIIYRYAFQIGIVRFFSIKSNGVNLLRNAIFSGYGDQRSIANTVFLYYYRLTVVRLNASTLGTTKLPCGNNTE